MIEWLPLGLLGLIVLVWYIMKRMWPVGLICYEKRGDSWILGMKSGFGARRIRKKDGTYNYELRPYKTKITPPSYESMITDRKGKTWLIAFSPNAGSFRAGIPREVETETVKNLAINEVGGVNNVIANGGIQIGGMEMPKVSFDTTDQHDIKDFMEDWRDKRERMDTQSFLSRYGIHILFLVQSIFIFILILTLIQGMPEMGNIWFQTAKVTKEATDNLLQAIGLMQKEGVVPGGATPPW